MSKETLLIVKIIFINLIVGLILLAFLSCRAVDLPPFPTAWKVGQKVHVKFTNFEPEDKAAALEYIKSRVDPLNLDYTLIFDDNIKRTDGLTEGIEIRNMTGTTTTCAKTSTFGGLTADNEWAVWKLIRLDTTCAGGKRTDGAFWFNNIMHEFEHALKFDSFHIQFLKSMPIPLLFSTRELRERLLWSYNDIWNLKRKYSRDRLLNYKRMNFKRADVGKTCYLVKGEKSVSFLIEHQSELLPYLEPLKNYKVVIK